MKSSIISFDIGIKHLSYCYFTVLENGKIDIVDWKLINIINDNTNDNTIPVACCYKTNKICSKKAIVQSKNGHAYCKAHSKKQTQYLVGTKPITKSSIQKCSREELELQLVTIENGKQDQTKRTKEELVQKVFTWISDTQLLPIVSSNETKCASVSLIDIGRNIQLLLDQYIIPLHNTVAPISHVIIENQISTIASRMTSVQMIVMQYFVMRFDNSTVIEFISSKNKLAFLRDIPSVNNENNYKQHKIDAKVFGNHFLQQVIDWHKWIAIIDSSKKKDDYYDCFFQGLWYICTCKKMSMCLQELVEQYNTNYQNQ